MLEENRIIGIDIGGTKISMGILVDGVIVNSIKLKTPAEGTQEEVVQQIIHGIESLPGYEKAVGIGIGAPGLIDEENGVIFSVNNIPSWKEVHLKEYLTDHFKMPVYITNDANCFAIGVKTYGEGQQYRNLVGLSLGTGVGAGIIIDGYLYSGQVACAGEFGGLPYRDFDFETYCSGKFFKQFHNIKGDKAYAAALEGDAQSLAMFEELGHHIGNLIKTMLFVLAPQAVFIGGSVGKSFHLWEKAMWKTVNTFPYKKALEGFVIDQSRMSKMSVIGAAALFHNRYEKDRKSEN
ncbi:ROK family protein [Gaoshiqia sediminis]|uniref:ROK family protein n=1 Tax=Gaoshiqia sediminis TaxID=2986998 RepID=A0AA41Y3P9_9BACT|nr:ROK family protein [Gaoshiqia sediminis]MCW0481299.1 ROK family protein [Gaoshiqia sediminis]